MLKLALVGTGRMGTLIRERTESQCDGRGEPLFLIVTHVGFDLDALTDAPSADVLIDFSNPCTLPAIAAYIRRTHTALLSGTTGYTDREMQEFTSLSKEAAVLHSGNYSLGIAALKHLVAQASRELAGFDVEICECHHQQKVDAPSGTAYMLLDALNSARTEIGQEQLKPVYGRQGTHDPRTSHEVGIHALRGGTVAGVHSVSFFGEDEELTLTHRATSRQIFVTGAIAAAQKLAGMPPALYSFDELMFG